MPFVHSLYHFETWWSVITWANGHSIKIRAIELISWWVKIYFPIDSSNRQLNDWLDHCHCLSHDFCPLFIAGVGTNQFKSTYQIKMFIQVTRPCYAPPGIRLCVATFYRDPLHNHFFFHFFLLCNWKQRGELAITWFIRHIINNFYILLVHFLGIIDTAFY